jgi:hypothetical protein
MVDTLTLSLGGALSGATLAGAFSRARAFGFYTGILVGVALAGVIGGVVGLLFGLESGSLVACCILLGSFVGAQIVASPEDTIVPLFLDIVLAFALSTFGAAFFFFSSGTLPGLMAGTAIGAFVLGFRRLWRLSRRLAERS